MKLRYFIIAAIFLFNPIFSTVDILPDFIGYFLIMRAFSNASYVYDNAYDAYKSARTMFLLTLAKFGCLFIIPFTDDTMTLVMSFAFGAVEIIFGITAFTRIFDSLSYVIIRTDTDGYIGTIEKIKKSSIVFLILKLVLAFLPDLSLLSDVELNSNALPISRFRPLFLGFCGIIALIFGTVWLVKFIKFFKNAITKELQQKINVAFKEKMIEKPGIFLAKNLIVALMMLVVGSLFVVDFTIDNVNVLPDFIFSAISLVAILLLIKNKRVHVNNVATIGVIVASTIHIIISVLSFVFNINFINAYSVEAVISIPQAEEKYLLVEILALIEAAIFFVLVVCLIVMFKDLAVRHIKENAGIFSEQGIDDYIKEFDENIQGKLMWSIIFAFLCAISSVLYTFLCPYSEGIIVISIICAIAFIIEFIRLMLTFHDEVYDKIRKYL